MIAVRHEGDRLVSHPAIIHRVVASARPQLGVAWRPMISQHPGDALASTNRIRHKQDKIV